jgi:hypothetical protein
VYIPGTPGLGVDTPDSTSAPAFLGVVYGAAFFAPLLALAASWKWPVAATWLALFAGIAAVLLSGLDLAGVLAGPAPAGMVVLNSVLVILGLAITWRAWRATRARATGAASS